MALLPYQVGITGGIGSGKSTVAKIFSALGVPVYDSDNHARSIMNTDAVLIEQIKNNFGNDAYDASGNLNRKFLAENVFAFPDRLEKLNGLVHPRVGEGFNQWAMNQTARQYVLKEAALLFETGSAKQLNKVIVVTAPEELRIKRVMSRDGRSEAETKRIIQRQWAEEKKISLADFIIQNDESCALIPQVLKIHQIILELVAHPHQ